MRRELVLGAVAYDPKVVAIWDGFSAYFGRRGLPFDYVLYSNYERQAEAQLEGEIDVAWSSPLAWIETARVAARRGRRAEAVAMRDTDRDLTSVVVVRADGGPGSVAELAGKVIATGAADSPQATLIPLEHLARLGLLAGRDVEVRHHDLLLGKHGDHVGGEREAVRSLLAGEADAACLLDGNLLAFGREGTLPPGATRVLCQTEPYDHCNFTVLDGVDATARARFTELLLHMSYEDPEVRPLLDMEGLRCWKPGRTTGYGQLEAAVDRSGFLAPWLSRMGA